MLAVVAIVVACGAYLASRSIVAEADAHRLSGTDRWIRPVCPECGNALDVTMRSCAGDRHPQRIANLWILLSTVVASVLLTVAAPSLWLVPAYVVFGWLMVLLTATDLDTKLIPNRILFPGTAVAIGLLVVGAIPAGLAEGLGRAAIGGAGFFALMIVLAMAARGGLGFGDVKLAFVIGAFAAFESWGHLMLAVLGGFILGGLTSGVLLITRRVGRRDAIPFGPFMTIAAVATLVFGQAFLDWYLG